MCTLDMSLACLSLSGSWCQTCLPQSQYREDPAQTALLVVVTTPALIGTAQRT